MHDIYRMGRGLSLQTWIKILFILYILSSIDPQSKLAVPNSPPKNARVTNLTRVFVAGTAERRRPATP